MLSRIITFIVLITIVIGIYIYIFPKQLIELIASYKDVDLKEIVYGYPRQILWQNELEFYALILIVASIFVILFSNYKLRKDIVNKPGTQYVIFGLYSVIVLLTTYCHEPWTDEAHAWLLARNATLSNFFSLTRYEIMPPLWLLILIPFAKLSLPYMIMNYLNALIVIIAMGLFYINNNFCFKLRTLILFSLPFFFEYPIIARTYGIALLILFSIAYLYNKRLSNPIKYIILLSLLPMTNVFMMLPALIFASHFMMETYINQLPKKQIIASIIIFITLFMMSIYAVWIPSDSIYTGIGKYSDSISLLSLLTAFYLHLPFVAKISLYILIPLSLIGVGLIIFILKKINIVFLKILLLMSLLWCVFIIGFKYGGDIRHYLMLFSIIIVIIWIAKQNDALNFKINNPIFFLLMLISVYFGAKQIHNDINYQFCGSKQTAIYILHNNIASEKIYCIGGQVVCAVMPYMPKTNFIFLSDMKPHKYIKRNKEWTQINNQEYNLKHKVMPNNSIISNTPLDTNKYNLSLVYHAPLKVFERGSYFWIYQTNQRRHIPHF